MARIRRNKDQDDSTKSDEASHEAPPSSAEGKDAQGAEDSPATDAPSSSAGDDEAGDDPVADPPPVGEDVAGSSSNDDPQEVTVHALDANDPAVAQAIADAVNPTPEDIAARISHEGDPAPPAELPEGSQPSLKIVAEDGGVHGFIGLVEAGARHISILLGDDDEARKTAARIVSITPEVIESADGAALDGPVAARSHSLTDRGWKVTIIGRNPVRWA